MFNFGDFGHKKKTSTQVNSLHKITDHIGN